MRYYQERSSMLVVLARLWPAVLSYNDPTCTVLYITTPHGQIGYRIVDRDLEIFRAAQIEIGPADDARARWDGSGKDEHNQRLHRAAADLAALPGLYSYRWTDTRTGNTLEVPAATRCDAHALVADLRIQQRRRGCTPDAIVMHRIPDEPVITDIGE